MAGFFGMGSCSEMISTGARPLWNGHSWPCGGVGLMSRSPGTGILRDSLRPMAVDEPPVQRNINDQNLEHQKLNSYRCDM
jgi:hypothetical protein